MIILGVCFYVYVFIVDFLVVVVVVIMIAGFGVVHLIRFNYGRDYG